MLAGLGSLKAAAKIVEAYKASGRAAQLDEARTLTGLVTGEKQQVAPGIFKVAKSAVKGGKEGEMTFDELKWRTVKYHVDGAGMVGTSTGAPATAENTRRWERNASQGRPPWATGPEPATP